MKKRNIIVGITGGVGTGKSTVLDMFKKLGAIAVNVDEIVHSLYKLNSKFHRKIVKEFGKWILGKNKNIDRKKLGKVIFNNKAKREKLNSIIHPEVKKQTKEIIDCLNKKNRGKIIAVEIPLLIETKDFKIIDKIVLVSAKRDVQTRRLRKKYRGYPVQYIKKIIDTQMPLSKKKKYADYIILNNSSIADTKLQVKVVFEQISCQKHFLDRKK